MAVIIAVAANTEGRREIIGSAQTSVESAFAIPVAPSCAVAAAFVAPGTDQAVDIGLHDQLKNSLGDAAQ